MARNHAFAPEGVFVEGHAQLFPESLQTLPAFPDQTMYRACVGKISEQSHQDDVRQCLLVLQGKDDELLAELHQRMNSLAERLDYEQAPSFVIRYSA